MAVTDNRVDSIRIVGVATPYKWESKDISENDSIRLVGVAAPNGFIAAGGGGGGGGGASLVKRILQQNNQK